jgi:microcompartment protein CcmK/EutM
VSHDKPFKRARSDWTEVVLVCRKCSKKLDGGFGEDGDEKLAKVLRKSVKAKGGGKGRKAAVAVIEVGCFDVCPKNAVVAVRASSPGDWVVVPRGASARAVTDRLGLALDGPPPVGEAARSAGGGSGEAPALRLVEPV